MITRNRSERAPVVHGMTPRIAALAITLLAACVPDEVGDDEVGETTSVSSTDGDSTSDTSDATSTGDSTDSTGDTGIDATTDTTSDSTDSGDECVGLWAEIRCSRSGQCFGLYAGSAVWLELIAEGGIEAVDVEAPCSPTAFSEVLCSDSACYAGEDGWFAEFHCETPIGALGWPAWMCDGNAGPIIAGPWDAVGCADELATSCLADSNSAAFEVWPECMGTTLITEPCALGSAGCACDSSICAVGTECNAGLECIEGECVL